MSKFRRALGSLWLMVLVAQVVRLVAVGFLYSAQLEPKNDYFSFGFETGRIARSIVLGHGYSDPLFGSTGPTAWIAPVYPYLLAGVFKLFGIYTKASALMALSLNSVFSAITCIPVVLMARRSFGPRVAAWAGWTWAFFPYAIQISAEWIWENTLTCLLLSILFVLTLRLERPAGLRVWFGYGLLWGFTALTSPVVLSLLPFLGGWACYRLQRRGERCTLPALVGVLAFLVSVAPWTIRNHRVFHQFMPLRDNFWLEVRVGNTSDVFDEWTDWAHPSNNPEEMKELKKLGELGYMAEKRQQALEFITAHPGQFVVLTLRRFVDTWTAMWVVDPHYLLTEQLELANIIFYTTATILALLGLRRAFRTSRELAAPYALVLLIFPLVFYVTHSNSSRRHRHPIDPEIVVLAVYAVANARASARQQASPTPGA